MDLVTFIKKILNGKLHFFVVYRKGFSKQHALISLIERWKTILCQKWYGGAVLMDLSKAFDTLNHDLLLAKLHAYGFDRDSLKVLHSYLSNRYQRTKINKILVRGVKLFLEYHKVLFLVLSSLIFI